MLRSGLKNFDVERNEYGFLVQDQMYNASKFRIKIPKIMPLVTQNGDIHEQYDTRSIFVNDTSCNVGPVNKVVTQNFITVPRSSFGNLSGPGSWNGNEFVGVIKNGQRVLISVLCDNIRDMFISDII